MLPVRHKQGSDMKIDTEYLKTLKHCCDIEIQRRPESKSRRLHSKDDPVISPAAAGSDTAACREIRENSIYHIRCLIALVETALSSSQDTKAQLEAKHAAELQSLDLELKAANLAYASLVDRMFALKKAPNQQVERNCD